MGGKRNCTYVQWTEDESGLGIGYRVPFHRGCRFRGAHCVPGCMRNNPAIKYPCCVYHSGFMFTFTVTARPTDGWTNGWPFSTTIPTTILFILIFFFIILLFFHYLVLGFVSSRFSRTLIFDKKANGCTKFGCKNLIQGQCIERKNLIVSTEFYFCLDLWNFYSPPIK